METNKEELIKKIKEKKELRGIDNEFVRDFLDNYLKKIGIDLNYAGKRELKLIIKGIRAELRRAVGMFSAKEDNRGKLLERGEIDELLRTHASTKERLENYNEIRKLIKELDVMSILDLGCGLNPIALAGKEVEYYASDINEKDLEIVRKFFEKEGIKGKVFIHDIRNVNEKLPKADLCLLLKIFDIIEKNGHKIAEEIIKKAECKYIIASFPSIKLSGKKMNNPRRRWIEQILRRLRLKFRVLEMRGEIFYIIDK